MLLILLLLYHKSVIKLKKVVNIITVNICIFIPAYIHWVIMKRNELIDEFKNKTTSRTSSEN